MKNESMRHAYDIANPSKRPTQAPRTMDTIVNELRDSEKVEEGRSAQDKKRKEELQTAVDKLEAEIKRLASAITRAVVMSNLHSRWSAESSKIRAEKAKLQQELDLKNAALAREHALYREYLAEAMKTIDADKEKEKALRAEMVVLTEEWKERARKSRVTAEVPEVPEITAGVPKGTAEAPKKTAKAPKRPKKSAEKRPKASPCHHESWKPKYDDRDKCPVCNEPAYFLLECNGCKTLACPACQHEKQPSLRR